MRHGEGARTCVGFEDEGVVVKRRSFLQVLGGGIAGFFAPMALAAACTDRVEVSRVLFPRSYPFDESLVFSAKQGPLCLARRRWDAHWWECYRTRDGVEEWVGSFSEEYLAETGITVERELRMLAGVG